MDEDQLTQDVITTQLDKIPQGIKGLIKNGDIRGNIEQFASVRGLSTEVARAVENEVMLVLLGLQDRENLFKNIKENVDIKDEDAQSLLTKINQVLLSPLEDSFAQMKKQQQAEEALTGDEDEEYLQTLNRDDVLAEIENPRPGNVRMEKMGPSDERPVTETLPKEDLEERGYSGGADPYREQI